MLAKFEEKQAVIEELRRKDAEKEQKIRTRMELDKQVAILRAYFYMLASLLFLSPVNIKRLSTRRTNRNKPKG
eukprot:9479132-Pyramimonas_sp.AAC.4